MLVTIMEIVVFMVAAAVIGLVLGWVLRGSMGSEQAELAQTRSQLRALKKSVREQQAASKAEAAPDKTTSKAQESADSRSGQTTTSVDAKKQTTTGPASASVAASKGTQAAGSKPVEKHVTAQKTATPKPAARKAAPVKKKSTAKVKSGQSKRKSLAEREADQAIGKQAFAEVVVRIGGPGTEDNLTKIYGVGKRYAEMLNELGLHSYAQISQLKKADLKTLAAALGVLDDRIEQEDWVSSAKVLLKAEASKAAK